MWRNLLFEARSKQSAAHAFSPFRSDQTTSLRKNRVTPAMQSALRRAANADEQLEDQVDTAVDVKEDELTKIETIDKLAQS
jgi:hypothetical protein